MNLSFYIEDETLKVRGQSLTKQDMEFLAEKIRKNKILLSRLVGYLAPTDTLDFSVVLEPLAKGSEQLVLRTVKLKLQTHFYKGAYLNTSSRDKMKEFEKIFEKYGVKLFFASIPKKEFKNAKDKVQLVSEGVLVEETSLAIGDEAKFSWKESELEQRVGKRAVWTSTLFQKVGDQVYAYRGEVKGIIAPKAGESGFGFDAFFIPEGESKTLGQSKPEKHNARAMAVEAFMKHLVYNP